MESATLEHEEQLPELEALSQKYPYCAAFHVLSAIGARQFDRLDASEQLAKAAVHIGDRSKLYRYTVRKGLLKRIAEAEEAHAEEDTAKQHAAEGDTAQVALPSTEALAGSPEQVAEADTPCPVNDGIIDTEPLEAEILREAASILGEYEVQSKLTEGASDEAPSQESPETGLKNEDPPKDNTETTKGPIQDDFEYSNFSRWLLGMQGDADHGSADDARRASQKAAQSKEQTVKKEQSPPDGADLIQRFIQKEPHITPAKASFFSPSRMGKLSLVEDESFVSETLAKIYFQQGDYKKAARAYKNLALKYPEKSVYFAALQKEAEDKT